MKLLKPGYCFTKALSHTAPGIFTSQSSTQIIVSLHHGLLIQIEKAYLDVN